MIFRADSPVHNVCRTRPPRGDRTIAAASRDADRIAAHLEDSAHYPGGHADAIAEPRTEADVAAILSTFDAVLAIGAQSSLTGGATPFGGVVLDMRRLDRIAVSDDGTRVVAGAGATLDAVQTALAARGAVFPPVPTFTGASVGGSVANNAAGAATFKYGSIRGWVESLTIVLANGEALDLSRGACTADATGFIVEASQSTMHVPLPTYRMPDVPKRSAGYLAAPAMDLVDLFIGSEGTLGVITDVTLRAVAPAPAIALALVFCTTERQAIDLTAALRHASRETWRTHDPAGIDACAIEYMDDRSLTLAAHSGTLTDLAIAVPESTAAALLIQLELAPGTTSEQAYDEIAAALSDPPANTALVRFCRLLDDAGLLDRTELAAPGDVQRRQQLLRFRESVPVRVNQLVGVAKRDVDPRIEKTAADMVVPFERFGEMMDIYRRGFAERDLEFAIWGHISDGNVHPNVIPRTFEDVARGKDAILAFGREVARLGGCPLAEHGVGRNPIKQALLRQLYGASGIDEMRAVKRALDPGWKLAPGVIFER